MIRDPKVTAPAWLNNFNVTRSYQRHLEVAGAHLGGTDWGMSTGTPLYAVARGVVERATANTYPRPSWYNAGLGLAVAVRYPSGSRTIYAHMSAFLVEHGATVSAGAVLGRSGNTGNSTGPHLHAHDVLPNGVTRAPAFSTITSPAGGGTEFIMSWETSTPNRDPHSGFAQSKVTSSRDEKLTFVEAYGKGLYEVDHRDPANPEKLTGSKQFIGRLVAFAEASIQWVRKRIDDKEHGLPAQAARLTAVAQSIDEVKALVTALGAPTSIEVTVPVASIKEALLDPEVVAALRGPTVDEVLAELGLKRA